MGTCTTCCRDDFRLVVIGTAASGVTTTCHALLSIVSEAENRRRVRNDSSATHIHPTLNGGSNNNSAHHHHHQSSTTPHEYRDLIPKTTKRPLIIPSVALKIFPSVPFAIPDEKRKSKFRRKLPDSIIVVDCGPVTHPHYRDSVQLNQQLREANGILIVVDATKNLQAQKAAKVFELVASGVRPGTPVFILVNKYDVVEHAENLIVPQDILQAQFPLLISSRCRTPWRCLPGASGDFELFDPTHIFEFLFDPTGLDFSENVVLMKSDDEDEDQNNGDHRQQATHNNNNSVNQKKRDSSSSSATATVTSNTAAIVFQQPQFPAKTPRQNDDDEHGDNNNQQKQQDEEKVVEEQDANFSSKLLAKHRLQNAEQNQQDDELGNSRTKYQQLLSTVEEEEENDQVENERQSRSKQQGVMIETYDADDDGEEEDKKFIIQDEDDDDEKTLTAK
jgi:hypothetical protein